MVMKARAAEISDAPDIARIYNQGIADRVATFETEPRAATDIARWFDEHHLIVIVEADDEPVAFASTSPYRSRACYAGVAEFSVYVARAHRGRGAGRMALASLIETARTAGLHKLVSRIFIENTASRALCKQLHFREVGIYEKHARLDRSWRDVVIVERLITENLG